MTTGGATERVALVTGGTRGIGRAITLALRESGYRVFVAARSAGIDDGADTIALDLAEPGHAAAAVRHVTDSTRRIDVLVNNAGMQHVGRIETYPMAEWHRMVSLNLTAPFEAIRAALPTMRSRGFGRIVNIASVHGLIASEGKAPYTATKHGLVGLTKAVALEVAEDPITCNAICPGFVETPLVASLVDQLAEERGVSPAEAADRMVRERQPSGRMISAEAVADLVRFLAGDDAARINGAAIPIDDAWTAR